MIKLIYRGVNYKSQSQQPNEQIQPNYSLTPSDRCGAKKTQNFNRLIFD
ncbi:MAG: hypothetical protein AAFO95_10880 [Cyanobacteria bacterium J06600_6]